MAVGGPFGRSWGDLLQLWLFGDYAKVSNVGGGPSENLSGYGLSIQFGVPGTQLLIQGAKKASGPAPSDGKDSARVYAQLSVRL